MSNDGSGLNVAAELAGLRGEMSAGFEAVKGQLALIAQKQDTTAKDVDDLEKRVTALEASKVRIPWGAVAALSGAVSAVGAAVGYLAQ